jgi:hypothetical protein
MPSQPEVDILKKYDKESSDYLRDMLFGDKLEKREKWFKLLKDPIFKPKYLMTLDE